MTKQIKPSLPKISGTTLPITSDEASLTRYIQMVQKIPLLTPIEEYDYAVKWRSSGDQISAEKLVSSHLRMVVSVAYDFKNYGISISDLIASGNLGLMQALQKFDPEKGFRFSTYAMFWIRAEIFDTILANWSIAKIGTSANQKKIFFNLARAKRALGIMDNNLSDTQTAELAKYLDVSETELTKMSGRMHARDVSLNAPLRDDSDGGNDILSNLADPSESIEKRLETFEFNKRGRALLKKHIDNLSERDRDILTARKLSDPVLTLEQLSEKYGISRERVRQIEEKAFEKLRAAILAESE